MLANLTAGYPDFVQNAEFVSAIYADPFRQWTPEEQIEISLSTPQVFAPGTNWDYSHSDYVILGQALEKITGQPLDVALQEQVLGPMGLRNTVGWSTPEIPEPVLHAFSSERRQPLGIPAGTRFYEESTYWNPSWSFAQGAIETTDIVDMTTTAAAIGEGTLLSPESHQAQIAPDLLGFGKPLPGCPACHTLDETYNYGLGVVLSNAWILQNPLFAGYGAVSRLPTRREDRHRGGHDLWRGSVRRPGQLQVLQPSGDLRRYWRSPRTGPPAAEALKQAGLKVVPRRAGVTGATANASLHLQDDDRPRRTERLPLLRYRLVGPQRG